MIITRTPFRISLFGGGTDLPDFYLNHGGAVISTTIDKYLYITCRKMPPFWEHKHRLVYGAQSEMVNRIDEIEHPSIRETLRFLNNQDGLDLHYNTDIPARSGIGSSSSFTVGLLHALHGLNGKMVSKRRLAAEAIHIEQDMIGEAVGCQDQIAAAFGGFNHIEFKKDDSFEISPIILDANSANELHTNLVLLFTGFQRFAVDIEKEKISKIDKNIKALSEMKEITSQALGVLKTSADMDEIGGLLHESWMLKKSLSDKVSTSRIDEIYACGMDNGALGGKILGAGGGGFILFYVRPEHRRKLLGSLSDLIHVPFTFEKTGSQVIYYREGD